MINNISSTSAISRIQPNKTKINQLGPIRNIIFVKAIDSYIDGYLEKRNASYVSSSKAMKTICFPDQPQVFWVIIRAALCRGKHAERALIDKRIDSETLNFIVLPMCAGAYEITFFGEEQ